MKLIAQITLASVLGFALAGCGASGTKANLADKFSADFGTFKKQVAECEKVVTYGVWGNPYHKELVQSYMNEIKEIKQKMNKTGSASELESLANKLGMSIDDVLAHIDEMDGRWILLDSFKNFGIIQANSMAVGDDTFISDNDMYHYPAIALADGEIYLYDRICQMQVNKTTNLKLNEVETLGDNKARKGFGSTGVR